MAKKCPKIEPIPMESGGKTDEETDFLCIFSGFRFADNKKSCTFKKKNLLLGTLHLGKLKKNKFLFVFSLGLPYLCRPK
ncbi:MAG: hypothetical protein IK011_03810 [Bacteroidaceae bacterium]|nr:hypothetical protein [Bacteroidaceae bacterium]